MFFYVINNFNFLMNVYLKSDINIIKRYNDKYLVVMTRSPNKIGEINFIKQKNKICQQ
jgi:hypothetical protein